MILLSQIIQFLQQHHILAGVPEKDWKDEIITGVTADSRAVCPGNIFTAISGSKLDGRVFAGKAVNAGACAIISDSNIPDVTVHVIKVTDTYLALAVLSSLFCGFPEKDIAFTAVTGTNGKTTTVYTLQAIDPEPEKCGIFTTITTGTGSIFTPSAQTTPDAAKFFKTVSDMKKTGCRRIYFEASSHALTQYRMGAIKLKSAIFTNFTRDHLDYHVTMENYFQAKKRLFAFYLAPGGRAVINSSDPAGKRLKTELQNEYPGKFEIADFGTPESAHRLEMLPAAKGCVFKLDGRLFRSNLTGSYNVQNLTGAILAAGAENVPDKIIVNVPGRLELFVREDGARLFVDFAHTPDALERVLTELRKLTAGKLITVFGAGGDRDQQKRPLMGKAVSKFADTAIVTSDNPRSEDPETIISMIKSGMNCSTCSVISEPDRAAAIKRAACMAKANDVILVAGKGHEKSQECNGTVIPFSDAAEALKAGFEKFSGQVLP